jgi:hypothetical protein
MIGHTELLKRIAQFMKKYLPEYTVQSLKFLKLNSRDLLIKLIPTLRSMGFVTSIEHNYSIYWNIDLSNASLIKELLTERLKELCKNDKQP